MPPTRRYVGVAQVFRQIPRSQQIDVKNAPVAFQILQPPFTPQSNVILGFIGQGLIRDLVITNGRVSVAVLLESQTRIILTLLINKVMFPIKILEYKSYADRFVYSCTYCCPLV